jgi:hypothetical protein
MGNVLIRKKRRLGIGLSLAFAAVIGITATFAWFTAHDSVLNRISTDLITDGSTEIVEVFDPPEVWKPGEDVTKNISVANTGSGDVLVRVSFEEIMHTLKLPTKAFDESIDAPAATGRVPQLFTASAYSTWSPPTAQGLTVSGAPAGLEIRAKKEVANAGKPNERVSWKFVAYHPITTGNWAGKAQKVTADFVVSGTTMTVSNVKYWAYDGIQGTEAAWAVFAQPTTAAPRTTVTRAAIEHPVTDALKKIIIGYTDKTSVMNQTPAAGKWWYNEADGFFYYIGRVASGTMTPSLLDKLTLDGSAGVEYSGMQFDMVVNLEAIQNTKDAIMSPTGWNLQQGSAALQAMEPFCA